ncbi:MAG: type II secretion system minor pseudopilin GspJ [Gammaproteobacteria bacterium]|nr:type II secretion system protein GspJ [Gammaproteobacteria bacterium]
MAVRPRQHIATPAAHSLRRRGHGFTLLEVLVAVAVFVVVGVLALGGYNALVKQSDILAANNARTRAVQNAVHRLVQDFASLEPRPVREPLGESFQPAMRADARSNLLAELTRSGWSNPAGVPRSTLQRVAYRLEEGRLYRDYWHVLDRTLTAPPTSVMLIDRVERVALRFLDANGRWHEQWPPLGYSGPDAPRLRPIAVEITLELEDWGEIRRLVEVAG